MQKNQAQRAGAELLHGKILKKYGLKQGTPKHDKLLLIGQTLLKRMRLYEGLMAALLDSEDIPAEVKAKMRRVLRSKPPLV